MLKKCDFLGIAQSRELKSRNIHVESFIRIDSTSAAAREYAKSGAPAPALFVANEQSAGRGRLGRSFFSPADTGVYLTLLLDVTRDGAPETGALTSAAAVAVRAALQRFCKTDCKIKWVNDIYTDGKKVCGILAESFFVGDTKFVAIGVGVNVGRSHLPRELEGIAASLQETADNKVRAGLAVELATGIFDIYGRVRAGDFCYMEEYREHSLVLGKEVVFTQNGVTKSGTVRAIDDSGALCVTLPGGEKISLHGGEITLRVK